jgi:hypothetical protein
MSILMKKYIYIKKCSGMIAFYFGDKDRMACAELINSVKNIPETQPLI